MGRDLGIADRLRARGLTVVEIDGWQSRGSDSFSPRGSVNHHTAGAGPQHGSIPSLGILINGRSDLPGPLCNVAQGRDNVVYVVAAGRANHAGSGGWQGLSGNSSVYGLEIENVGTPAEPWREDQVRTAELVHAALLDGVPADARVLPCQHYEWTTRKIDAHEWDGDQLRAAVGALLGGATPPAPTPEPTPEPPSRPLLKKGSKGDAVRVWQEFLRSNIDATVAVDGAFGPHTERATQEFQRRVGLVADGIVGPRTWAAMDAYHAPPPPRPMIRKGDRGEHVRYAQQRLNAHGARLGVDGVFGPRTHSAVVSFQRRNGLAADGIVGPRTWAALG